ncbi:MAG: hypothetical protein QF464_18120, partial [Myxococcota bacterium]|nr:hypothetical protein [Myxococcota bacterium]
MDVSSPVRGAVDQTMAALALDTLDCETLASVHEGPPLCNFVAGTEPSAAFIERATLTDEGAVFSNDDDVIGVANCYPWAPGPATVAMHVR